MCYNQYPIYNSSAPVFETVDFDIRKMQAATSLRWYLLKSFILELEVNSNEFHSILRVFHEVQWSWEFLPNQ